MHLILRRIFRSFVTYRYITIRVYDKRDKISKQAYRIQVKRPFQKWANTNEIYLSRQMAKAAVYEKNLKA